MENDARRLEINIERNFIRLEYGEYIGIADLQSNIIIPVKIYEYFIEDDSLIFAKEVEGEWNVYRVGGKNIQKLEYEEIVYEEDEYVLIKIDGRWELCDLTYYLAEPDEDFEEEFDD